MKPEESDGKMSCFFLFGLLFDLEDGGDMLI
jgi:hypothetical protein